MEDMGRGTVREEGGNPVTRGISRQSQGPGLNYLHINRQIILYYSFEQN